MGTERRFDDSDEGAAADWLTSQSDLMTNLLAIFAMLFALSLLTQATESSANAANASAGDNESKNGQSSEIVSTEAPDSAVSDLIDTGDGAQLGGYTDAVDDQFDKIFLTIKEKIDQSGYSDSIILEKSTEYIKFRFNDSVLFYPDSPTMRETSFDILKYMGDLLYSIDDLIMSIEIGGHTATTGEKTSSFFSWELSSDRAIAVLKFFVNNCSMPESKMVVSGYSRYQPVASNDTEASRAQNRRVEVKITRVGKKTD
ncbi:MAG: OmpA family protein [Clostridiaceae bacterium]|nr:OmpA family protein [Clostridiaceae bacterium]